MNDDDESIEKRDLRTLRGVIKGPGFYATPSPDRIKRLESRGWIKSKNAVLRATWKGRFVAFFNR